VLGMAPAPGSVGPCSPKGAAADQKRAAARAHRGRHPLLRNTAALYGKMAGVGGAKSSPKPREPIPKKGAEKPEVIVAPRSVSGREHRADVGRIEKGWTDSLKPPWAATMSTCSSCTSRWLPRIQTTSSPSTIA